MLRRRTIGSKKLVFFQKRFYPAGNYTWTVPAGCMWVDVFLVGGGCGGNRGYSDTGGAGGYTKTFKKDTSGWRDGDAIPVIPGQSISIRVGKGSSRSSNSTPPNDGGYSQFLNSNYRAYGGSMYGSENNPWRSDGGSGSGGGGSIGGNGGSDGSNGSKGHTTRDFGESSGKRNAAGGGGGGGERYGKAGVSDYKEGKGSGVNGGGGYGGGGGSEGDGGDGTVLIRYWAYEE
jgi:hypothetical protein